MSKVADLIAEAAAAPEAFTGPMLADIRKVLAANDAQPNRLKRVSREAMITFLRETHGYACKRCAFDEHLRQALGRGWNV